MEKYYDPNATVADIEVLLGVTYGTARRRLHMLKKDLGLSSRAKVTISQVYRYFRIPIQHGSD